MGRRRKSAARQRIRGRYVRRTPDGKFKKSVDIGRSLSADRRQKAKTIVRPGQGDRGDQRPRTRITRRKKSLLFG